MHYTTLCLFLAIAAVHGIIGHQLDVESAPLRGDVDRRPYAEKRPTWSMSETVKVTV